MRDAVAHGDGCILGAQARPVLPAAAERVIAGRFALLHMKGPPLSKHACQRRIAVDLLEEPDIGVYAADIIGYQVQSSLVPGHASGAGDSCEVLNVSGGDAQGRSCLFRGRRS